MRVRTLLGAWCAVIATYQCFKVVMFGKKRTHNEVD